MNNALTIETVLRITPVGATAPGTDIVHTLDVLEGRFVAAFALPAPDVPCRALWSFAGGGFCRLDLDALRFALAAGGSETAVIDDMQANGIYCSPGSFVFPGRPPRLIFALPAGINAVQARGRFQTLTAAALDELLQAQARASRAELDERRIREARLRQLDYENRFLREKLAAMERSASWRIGQRLVNLSNRLPFARLLRRGVKPDSRTSIELPAEHDRQEFPISLGPDILHLKRPLLVAIPVYNGFQALCALLDSLAAAYPVPRTGLRFLFIDDCSTQPQVRPFLEQNPFLRRPDVQLLCNTRNLGFVRSINLAIEHAPPDADLVILNADTLVNGQPFEVLQDVACREDDIASVTPLTNRGTIASLPGWPHGEDSVWGLPPAVIAATIAARRWKTPPVGAPTGVGFCMYMTRQALDRVGAFDPEAFGQGYGEENDWCRRAMQQGFRHLICTEAYVHHAEAQSFGLKQKNELLARNLAVLNERYPDYALDVERYTTQDPLRSIRELLLFELRVLAGRDKLTLAFVLHNSPDCGFGGTERHAQWLANELLRTQSCQVLFIFPESPAPGARVRFRLCTEACASATLEYAAPAERCAPLLSALLEHCDVLHIHHLAHLPDAVVDTLIEARNPRKLFTLHDFSCLCPRVNLVNADGRYCALPSELAVCDACLARGEAASGPILAWRKRMRTVLMACDVLLFPSSSAWKIVNAGFARHPETALPVGNAGPACVVLPHFLPFAEAGGPAARIASACTRTLVFLGELTPLKGGDILRQAAADIEARGFACEVWGDCPGLPASVRIRRYQGWESLPALAREVRPFAVCLPSIWPETFSYTLYEALALTGRPVLTGPWGNPATFVRENGVGVAMERPDAASLLAALGILETEAPRLTENLAVLLPELLQESRSGHYLERYLELAHSPGEHRRPVEPDRGAA